MNHVLVISLATVMASASGWAQERIYRCGNEYTNTLPGNAQARGCRLVDGGNVTVVQGPRPAAAAAARPAPGAAPSASPTAGPRIDSGEQKARDFDARRILESELKKAETRFAELQKEYNNGEPDKQGGEARNHQKYLDRVGEMKAELARLESDMGGIRRELGRLPAAR